MTRPDAFGGFTIDLEHQGRKGYVACRVLETDAGPVLVDTGPGSTLERLREGLRLTGHGVGDLHAILLTHIHLDHAGATGSLARENPRLRVFVHHRGSPHLVDPTKLLASATRIYGDQMDQLWGEFLPVPADQVEVVNGGEAVSLGRHRFRVGYTPGHASHHVSYLDEGNGTAYVGDTGGILPLGLPSVVPVTPPPEFDLERWLQSIDTILGWGPDRLYLTHFGFSHLAPAEHLAQLREGLADWTATARRSLEEAGEDDARAAQFSATLAARLASRLDPEQLARFVEFADFRGGWYGLARYWRKRLEPA